MYKARAAFLLVLFLSITVFLIYRAAVLTLGEGERLLVNLSLMNRSPTSINLLVDHVNRLGEMMDNVEDISFSVLKNALEETITLARLADREFKAQKAAWDAVQDEIKKDNVNYRELKEQVEQLQSMEDDKIIRIKKRLDEASKLSTIETTFNFVITFILGILTQMLATQLLNWFALRRSQRIENEI